MTFLFDERNSCKYTRTFAFSCFIHSFNSLNYFSFVIYRMKLSYVNVNKFVLHIVPVKVNVTVEQSQFPEGSEISIGCGVDGYPIPRVLWYKNNELIRTDNRIKISGKIIDETPCSRPNKTNHAWYDLLCQFALDIMTNRESLLFQNSIGSSSTTRIARTPADIDVKQPTSTLRILTASTYA